MTLRQKWRFTEILAIIGLIVLLMSAVIGLIMPSIVLMVLAMILNLVWLRCPECGKWLGRDPGNFCKSCGTQIPWDEKTKRNL